MPETTQTYSNHTRLDPPYHFFVTPVSLVAVLLGLWSVWKDPGLTSGAHLVSSIALVIAILKLRLYPLKVQDRLIRLEERLRISALVPEKIRPRIQDLTEGQLIALRFASDQEIPELVEKALANKMAPGDIKKSIRNWRPDYFRV